MTDCQYVRVQVSRHMVILLLAVLTMTMAIRTMADHPQDPLAGGLTLTLTLTMADHQQDHLAGGHGWRR